MGEAAGQSPNMQGKANGRKRVSARDQGETQNGFPVSFSFCSRRTARKGANDVKRTIDG